MSTLINGRLRMCGIAATLLVAIGLSGCGQLGQILSDDGGSDRERQQAKEALARWAAAVEADGGRQGFVPVGELTGQVGDWEPEVGENNKLALMGGMIAAAAELPAASGDTEVRWDDGTTKTMPTISAEQALEELRASSSQGCPECASLQVTAARLSTATFQTSRGPATAPVWEFALDGTDVLVTRIAVSANNGVVVEPPAWDPNNPPTGLSIDSVSGTVGGTQLTVAFIGAPDAADKPCGEDYITEAVESDTAVVVIVTRHRNGFAGGCTAVGARRTATVELAAPLGERAVLEVMEGRPVPVLLTP
jgi:hypothetical protein